MFTYTKFFRRDDPYNWVGDDGEFHDQVVESQALDGATEVGIVIV